MLLALISFVPAMSSAAENVPQKAETVCLQCHPGLPGKYSQPVSLWRGSVHAESGVTCHSCHGGDPNDMVNAMSPQRGFLGVPKEKEIPSFCGRCHIGVLKDYMASAHGLALGKNGPTCVTCHGSHAIEKANLDLINEKSCTRCHSYDRARLIREAMKDTEGMITVADERLKNYKKIGSDTEKLEKSLFAVRNSFHTLFHDVDVEKVKRETAKIQEEIKKISNILDKMDATMNNRKKAGFAAVAVSLLAALLFYFLRKTYS
jgi:hypothetical protein